MGDIKFSKPYNHPIKSKDDVVITDADTVKIADRYIEETQEESTKETDHE